MAEKFSGENALFIIKMEQKSASDQGVCIASLSQFTGENEVLLRPGMRFTITEIRQEKDSQRQIIFVDIIPHHLSSLHQ